MIHDSKDEGLSKFLKLQTLMEWIPNSICNKFRGLCEAVKVLICVLYLFIVTEKVDLIIIDQWCLLVPILRLKANNLIFVCTEPDLVCDDLVRLFPSCLHRLVFLIGNIIAQLAVSMAS